MQVWDMAWVRRTVHDAAYGGDMRAAWQLWTWLQREAWGLIPGVPSKPCVETCLWHLSRPRLFHTVLRWPEE